MCSTRNNLISPEVYRYITTHSHPVDDVQRELIDQTMKLGDVSTMQVGSDQGTLLTLFTQMTGARNVVEVGTFTGYSALAIARGLPSDGRLLCCDVSEEWTSIARQAWEKAGVADKIELRIAPALETLRSLPPDLDVDLVFIDADKPAYVSYYEELIPRMRPGGILLADNVLWSGRVADEAVQDANTVALRQFNEHVAGDKRVEAVVLSIGDGLTLARKL